MASNTSEPVEIHIGNNPVSVLFFFPYVISAYQFANVTSQSQFCYLKPRTRTGKVFAVLHKNLIRVPCKSQAEATCTCHLGVQRQVDPSSSLASLSNQLASSRFNTRLCLKEPRQGMIKEVSWCPLLPSVWHTNSYSPTWICTYVTYDSNNKSGFVTMEINGTIFSRSCLEPFVSQLGQML